MRPPFRADHVGSLLRPPELKRAREEFKVETCRAQASRKSKNAAIRKAVALQEAAGLQSVTDGEFRRAFWHVDFLTGFDGIVATQGQYALKFHGEGGAESETKSMMVVTGKVKRTEAGDGGPFRVPQIASRKKRQALHPRPDLPAHARRAPRGQRRGLSRR